MENEKLADSHPLAWFYSQDVEVSDDSSNDKPEEKHIK
jgi:hypothetical protein